MTANNMHAANNLRTFLAIANAYDPRVELSGITAQAWESAIGDLGAPDALEALVAHYRESRDRVMPADVRERVTAARRARAEALPSMEAILADAFAVVRPDVNEGHLLPLYQARRKAMLDDRISLDEAIRRYPVPASLTIPAEIASGEH